MDQLYHSQGHYKKAIEYSDKTLKLAEEALGKDHSLTKKSRENRLVLWPLIKDSKNN